MLPLCQSVGLPIEISGSVLLLVRLSEVAYPNVFINRSRSNAKSPLLFCSPKSWARVYEPATYSSIPLVTACPNARFMCQMECTAQRKRCQQAGK